MSNSEYAIHIQLDKLLNQLNVNNFFRIMKLIRDPCLDIKNEFLSSEIKKYGELLINDIKNDINYIVDGVLNQENSDKNLMRLEALLSDDETMYVKLLIEKVNRIFNLKDFVIDDMRSIYLFIKDNNMHDAYMLANELGLDGLTYNVV